MTRKEFRLRRVYLRRYFELLAMFDAGDAGDDRRGDVEELKTAGPLLEGWGVKVEDPVAAFKEIDKDGFIIDPIRCDWIPGGVFITPPGWWHSHHNESDATAWVLPIQDAGLYTHQRTLDIRFADDEIALHREGRIRGTAFNITNKQYLEVVSTHQAHLDAADNDVPNFNYGL